MKGVMALAVLALLLGATTSPAAPVAEGNKALVRRYVGLVVNGHRLDMLDGLVSPNYKRYISPIAAPLSLEGQKQRLAGFFAAFPDLRCTIEDLIAEGDRVAYRLTCPITHQGTFLGIAPTGKQVVAQALEVVRIENGKFIEHWGGPDLLNMLQQLGAVVSAPPSLQSTRTVLLKTEKLSGIPGMDAYVVDVNGAPGGQTGWHVHPGHSFEVVLDGEVTIEAQGQPPAQFKKGMVWHLDPMVPHNGINSSQTAPVHVMQFFVVESEKPLQTSVPAPTR